MKEIRFIGSRILKINAERNPNFSGKLQIKTDIKIQDLEKIKESKETMKVSYIFTVDYVDLGKIKIEGVLFLAADAKKIKELIKLQKEGNFKTPESVTITNIIIQKSSLKAFELEEELGLPTHIRLPTIKFQEKQNN
jgi:hypothetical protein